MKRILMVLALLVIAGFAFAASANVTHVINLQVIEVVAVGLNDASAITLTTVAPVTPGDPPTGQSNNSKYLRYTTVNSGVTTRRVTAQMSVAAPAGTALQLETTIGSGGAGTQGVTTGPETLTNASATDVITGIASCYTGTGGTDGAQLTYTLLVTAPGSLVVAAAVPVTITLTLTDAS